MSRPPRARHSFTAALTVVATSTFVGMLAYAGPLGNAATISHALAATPATEAWMLAAMSAGLAVALLAAGVIGDRIGRRRVFLLGTAIFVLANLGSALALDPAQFILARVGAGVGAAGAIATSLGLAAVASRTPRDRTRTAIWWSASLGGGIALGPIITGLLDLAGLWRLFFVLLAVGGLLVLLGAIRWIAPDASPSPTDPAGARPSPRPFDGIGFTLLLALLATLIAAIVQARAGGVTAWALSGATVLLLIGLVVSQRVGSRRVIAPALLSHPPFLATTLASFGTGLGVIAAMSFVSTWLVQSRGVTTLVAGILMAAWSATSAVAALGLARLTARMPGPVPLVVGLTGVALGLGGLAVAGLLGAEASVCVFLPGMTIAGIATGVLNSGLARQAVATVPPEAAATGTAASNTARYFGAALGITLASVVAGGHAAAGGFDLVAWGAAAVSLVAAITAALLSRRPGRASVVEVPSQATETLATR